MWHTCACLWTVHTQDLDSVLEFMQRVLRIGSVNAFQFVPQLPITGIDQALVRGRGGMYHQLIQCVGLVHHPLSVSVLGWQTSCHYHWRLSTLHQRGALPGRKRMTVSQATLCWQVLLIWGLYESKEDFIHPDVCLIWVHNCKDAVLKLYICTFVPFLSPPPSPAPVPLLFLPPPPPPLHSYTSVAGTTPSIRSSCQGGTLLTIGGRWKTESLISHQSEYSHAGVSELHWASNSHGALVLRRVLVLFSKHVPLWLYVVIGFSAEL